MLYLVDDTLPLRRCFISPQTDNAYSRQKSQVPDKPVPAPDFAWAHDEETQQQWCNAKRVCGKRKGDFVLWMLL
jgi:hypothetical protein